MVAITLRRDAPSRNTAKLFLSHPYGLFRQKVLVTFFNPKTPTLSRIAYGRLTITATQWPIRDWLNTRAFAGVPSRGVSRTTWIGQAGSGVW